MMFFVFVNSECLKNNREKIPFAIEPIKCDKKRIYPKLTDPSIPVPTAPIINKGPDVLLNVSIFCPSSGVIFLSAINCETIFAPEG